MRLWVTGYRSYELGIFNDNDPKIEVIKYTLRQFIEQQFNNRLEWIISSGQLGIEQWAIEEALELKKDYPELKTSLMYPYSGFGKQWNQNNQQKLTELENKVDFVASTSKQAYQSPKQLKNYQQFMLTHTDAALMIYDFEYPGKSKYDYEAIQKFKESNEYSLTIFNMQDLQDKSIELNDKKYWQS
ncbi:DUF1273 domain-containing protein [Ligilactobacillus sp. LYQ135]